jgi:hypothetical protein
VAGFWVDSSSSHRSSSSPTDAIRLVRVDRQSGSRMSHGQRVDSASSRFLQLQRSVVLALSLAQPAVPDFEAAPIDSSSREAALSSSTEYELLISRCDANALAGKSWTFSNGPEWAGSSGSLTAASPQAAALTLSYNFSGQSTKTRGYVAAEFYHGASALSAVKAPTALSIQLAGAAASIMVRVVDALGQTHLGGATHNATDKQLVVALTKAALPTHYGPGPTDGVIHFPLTKVAIGVDNRGDQAGSLLLSNLSLHTLTAPAATLLGTVAPVQSFGIAYADEVREAGGHQLVVNVTNVLRTSCDYSLELRDASGAVRPYTAKCSGINVKSGDSLVVAGWGQSSCTCTIADSGACGYHLYSLQVQALGRCANPTQQAGIESALVVIDRNLHPRPDVSRAFGSQFFGADMASAAARLGIAHTRIQVYWRWMQRTVGATPDLTSGGMQSMIESAVANNISVTLDMRAEPPDWAIDSNGSAADRYSPWTLYPRPQHLPAYTKFVTDVLRQFCGMTHGVEVGNEPDSQVYYGTPLVPLEQAVPLYIGTMEAVQNATQSVCPGLKQEITALSVSGEEFWTVHNFKFVRGVLSALAASPGGAKLAAVSPHPYARQHYLPTVAAAWGNASWTMPEDVLPSQFSLTDGLHNLSRVIQGTTGGGASLPIRPTEFGYGLSQNESAASKWAREHAAAIAQYCILLRTVPEVDRFFLFSATFPGLETGTSYGMFRTGQPGDVAAAGMYPLPAAAAFAMAARMTDHVGSRFAHRVSGLPASLTGLTFTTGVTQARSVVAVWTHGTFEGMDRDRTLQFVPISVELPAGTVVTAGTGEVLRNDTGGSSAALNLTLEAMPTYFECDGSNLQRLETAVRQARGMPPQ